MIQPDRRTLLAEHKLSQPLPGRRRDSRDSPEVMLVSDDINMGELMITDSECPAPECVEAPRRTAPAGRSAMPASRRTRFSRYGPVDIAMTVFAHDPDARTDPLGGIENGSQATSSSPTSRGMSQPDGPKRWGS